jgi:hypothetical protein
MISEALIFLKNHLNEHLSAQAGMILDDSGEDKVVFVDGEKLDPISFKLGAVTTLLINVEEEKTLRPADPYVRVSEDGVRQRVAPEIRLNLHVLFVARFKRYEHGLAYLSRIIAHFQAHRVLDHHNAPALGDRLERLIMELTTLSFAEQNEVWNALRTTYHPSVLYRVKLVAFRDDPAIRTPEVVDKQLEVSP